MAIPSNQSAVFPGQRETSFEEIRARVAGTRLAAAQLGL
jgi:hypothetical protein